MDFRLRMLMTEKPIFQSFNVTGNHLLQLCVSFAESLTLCSTLRDVINSEQTTRSEKQAAVSYWACQPLLSEVSELKELLLVEVPDFLIEQNSTPRKAS